MTSVRLRWAEILMPLLKKYKLNITWGDQDLLNIMFFHNPGKSTLIFKSDVIKLLFCMMFRNPEKQYRKLFSSRIQQTFSWLFSFPFLRNSFCIDRQN